MVNCLDCLLMKVQENRAYCVKFHHDKDYDVTKQRAMYNGQIRGFRNWEDRKCADFEDNRPPWEE